MPQSRASHCHARSVAFLVSLLLLSASTRPSAWGADVGRLAPGPVVVRLRNAADNKPLAGIVVHIGARYAATKPDGALTLDGIPAGQYRLVIEPNGFERIERAGAPVELKIAKVGDQDWFTFRLVYPAHVLSTGHT